MIRAYAVVGGGDSYIANYLDGGAGDDRLYAKITALDGVSASGVYSELDGGAGDDYLYAKGGDGNILNGGSGDDTIRLDAPTPRASGINGGSIQGGAGNDKISVKLGVADYFISDPVFDGGAGNDKLTAKITMRGDGGPTGGTVFLSGGSGNDTVSGSLSVNSVSEQNWPNKGTLSIEGGNGDDRLSGSISGELVAAHSELYGGAGNDRLTVRGGEGNILNGGAGNDTLIGGSGSDTLIGLQGDDALQGKGGADIFLFGFIRSGERDRIADFVIGEDVIDLSQIDANRDRAGEQSFRFGTREGTGRAWIEEDPDSTGSILFADDGHRVLEVRLKDGRGVSADSYHASDFLL